MASLIVAAATASTAGPQPTASGQKRVLALFDFGKDAPANVIWDATPARSPRRVGRRSRASSTTPSSSTPRASPAPEHAAVMHDYLRRKYAGMTIDVIIAMDLSSRFLVGRGRDLFADVPVVHTVAAGRAPGGHQRRSAPGRHPRRVRRAAHARDRARLSPADHARWRSSAPRRSATASSRPSCAASWTGLRTEGQARPTSSICRWRRRWRGRRTWARTGWCCSSSRTTRTTGVRRALSRATSPARSRAASGAPVYGLYSSYLHDGVVGGYVYSLRGRGGDGGADGAAHSRGRAAARHRAAVRADRADVRLARSCSAGASTRRGCRRAARCCSAR